MTADNRAFPPLSAADLAALDAVAAANLATHQALQALQELARAMVAGNGIAPEKPRRQRSYRLTNVTRGADGELAGDVEYGDGRVRRLRVARDDNGDIVGELDDMAASDDGSAPLVAPEPGAFADVFGSIVDL